MAASSQHQQPFTVNEIIKYCETTCLITGISNKLGFNSYQLIDIDTGTSFTGYGYQLMHTEEVAAALLPDFGNEGEDTLDTPDIGTTECEEESSMGENGGRWADVSEKDIENLAANRHSKHTANQTKWAVKVFKGTVLA